MSVSARTAGYTLIEMLASLIILGFMSALMHSGLNTGRRVWEHADKANIAGETVSGSQLLLRERLERIFPATRYDKIPTYADFTGTAEAVNFLSPPRDIHAPQGLMRYMLALASNGDLVLSSASDLAVDAQTGVEQMVLLHNVQQLDISYYGVVPPDKTPSWHDQWGGMAVLPLLIRVRVQFPPDDPRAWPELVVKPFATVDSMCVLTVMTGKCRGRA
jgi:general secretion pathway protein J